MRNFPRIAPRNFLCAWSCHAAARVFSCEPSLCQERKSNNPLRILRFVPPLKRCGSAGILTCCPSPAAFAIGLGPTNPPLMFIAEEPLGFRRSDISSDLWLLVPTFSLPNAPVALAGQPSLRWECSSTACATANFQLLIAHFRNQKLEIRSCANP